MRRVVYAAVLAIAAPWFGVPVPAAEPTRETDFDLARTEYVEQSRGFSDDGRKRALAFIERERGRVGKMTDAEFLLTMQRIPAFADNGHDVLNDEPGAWFPDARLPLRMVWFPDGWVVARAAPQFAELAGARVRTIESLTPGALLARMRPLVGGIDGYRLWNLEWIIEYAGLLHALGIARNPNGLALVADLPDGSRVERYVRFVPKSAEPRAASATRLLMPDAWASERERGWRFAPIRPVPLYLADADRLYRHVALPTLNALYIQFRLHLDSREEKLADFTAAVDADIARLAPRNLIADLRFDTGGNTDLTRDWIRTVHARIPGRIFVIVSRYTFSAGIVTAAAFKHDGGAKVTLVGEPVGDRLIFWSEGKDVCLPKSHYCLHRTTGQWNLEQGCAGLDGCYGDKYDATVGSLEPDLPATLSAQDWLAGRDAALEAIRSELGLR